MCVFALTCSQPREAGGARRMIINSIPMVCLGFVHVYKDILQHSPNQFSLSSSWAALRYHWNLIINWDLRTSISWTSHAWWGHHLSQIYHVITCLAPFPFAEGCGSQQQCLFSQSHCSSFPPPPGHTQLSLFRSSFPKWSLLLVLEWVCHSVGSCVPAIAILLSKSIYWHLHGFFLMHKSPLFAIPQLFLLSLLQSPPYFSSLARDANPNMQHSCIVATALPWISTARQCFL